MLLFLFLVALTAGAAASSEVDKVQLQSGDCPSFWFSFSGRCYRYVATPMTWGQAELNCVSQGGNLVSIHSLEEHNFVKSLASSFDPAHGWTWIGLTDIHVEGGWMWSDGSPVNFVFWSPNEPNNFEGSQHCGQINYGTAQKWDDFSCSRQSPSVCVQRKVCPEPTV